MKTGKLLVGVILAIIMQPGNSALCQEAEETTGRRYGENVKWKTVFYVKFKEGIDAATASEEYDRMPHVPC